MKPSSATPDVAVNEVGGWGVTAGVAGAETVFAGALGRGAWPLDANLGGGALGVGTVLRGGGRDVDSVVLVPVRRGGGGALPTDF